MNLSEFLKAEPGIAEHPVMEYRGVALSRRELFERAEQVALHWLQMGLEPGDGVALLLRHPAVHLVCLLAVARMAAVAAVFKPDNPGFAEGGDMHRLGFRTLVHDLPALTPDVEARFERVLGARELLMGQPKALLEASHAHLAGDHSTRPWYLPQSSGTTGQPKTVVVSQTNTLVALQMGDQFEASDRVLVFTDMSMYWTVLNVMRILRAGATCLPVSTGSLPGTLLKAMHEMRANKLLLSADAAAKLLSYMEDFGPAALGGHRLDQVCIGGGQVSPALAKGLHAFLGAKIMVVYGSTEAGPMAYVHGAERHAHVLHCLYPGVQAEVVDDADQVLPTGQQGRLRIHTPALFSGYLQGDQWPKQAPQWFYPGDLAVLQPQGLQLMGRADHVLNLGGLKIDPETLEQVFRADPAVLDAAVMALPLGEKQVRVLLALLVLKSADKLPEVRAAFERQHAKALQPQHYALVHELPRNLSGKLQRGLLLQMVRLESVS